MGDPKGTDKSVKVVNDTRRSSGRVSATSQPVANPPPRRPLGRRAKVAILVALGVFGTALVLVVVTDDDRSDGDGVAKTRANAVGPVGTRSPSTGDGAAESM